MAWETVEAPGKAAIRHAGVALAIAIVALYVMCFLATPPGWLGQPLSSTLSAPRKWVNTCLDGAYGAIGVEAPSRLIRHGGYLIVTAGALPWLIMAGFGRGRTGDIGFRLPNVIAWRVLLVGFLASVPFLVWMVRGPMMSTYYARQIQQAGAVLFVGYYVVNMAAEHFFFHGIVLGACRPGLRWPSPAPVHITADGRLTRMLQWIGLAQPVGGSRGLKRIICWIGLPEGCVPAILTSGILFGAVHLGKDPRELLLSVPGGMCLAYLAYRTNSWLVPWALHLATAGTAYLMIPHP